MKRAEAVVIPIILQDCLWKSQPFCPRIDVLPEKAKPVSNWG